MTDTPSFPPTSFPYPHLLTHPHRAMTLVYTPEAEAENLAQGYTVVDIDTRQIVLLSTKALHVSMYHG